MLAEAVDGLEYLGFLIAIGEVIALSPIVLLVAWLVAKLFGRARKRAFRFAVGIAYLLMGLAFLASSRRYGPQGGLPLLLIAIGFLIAGVATRPKEEATPTEPPDPDRPP